MDRREFLAAKPRVKKNLPKILQTSPSSSGLQPYTGPFERQQIVHLLKRTMFGASLSDLNFFDKKPLSDVVDFLLNPTAALPDPPIKEYVTDNALVPDTSVNAGETWVNDPATDGTITSRRRASMKKWWTGVMINQDRSIREKLTLFWHNHFATEFADVSDSQFLYKHHTLLRTNCLGNFKSLVRAVTIDPAMLVYLNGKDSTATAPNENYGRELQELFTVGKENNPNYTEADVKAAARALTGWQTSSATISSLFNLSRHDRNAKAFSSFYGYTIPARNAASAGDDDLTDLVNMIFNKKAEVASFMVRNLYRWFCYYDINPTIEANIIGPLADIFAQSNWEIKPVLSVLLKSEHFYDSDIRGSVIKSPIDLTVGMCREFAMAFPTIASNYDNAYAMFEYVRSLTASMGQSIGDPPNVAGWPAYYQAPQFHEIWLNADTLPKRNQFTDRFSTSNYTRNSFVLKIDVVGFTKTLTKPDDPNAVISDALELLLQVPISATMTNYLKSILLSGQVTDSYWTDAWRAYLANPATSGTPYKTVETRLKTFYKYIMNLPEYQLA